MSSSAMKKSFLNDEAGYFRLLIGASWFLYALGLFWTFPMLADYIVEEILIFILRVIGLIIGVLVVFAYRYWRTTVALVASVFLVLYVERGIARIEVIRSVSSDINAGSAITEAFQEIYGLIQYEMSSGHPVFGLMLAYSELIMPLLQASFIIYLIVKRFSRMGR